MYLQKVIAEKLEKNIFCWHLEGQGRKKQDPDPLVRGLDSDPYRISILIGHIYNLVTVRILIRHYKKVRDQDEDMTFFWIIFLAILNRLKKIVCFSSENNIKMSEKEFFDGIPGSRSINLNEQGSGIRCCRPVIGFYVPFAEITVHILWYCIFRRTYFAKIFCRPASMKLP
jgi:hypothetical protein